MLTLELDSPIAFRLVEEWAYTLRLSPVGAEEVIIVRPS
jgi:hypothetical protein